MLREISLVLAAVYLILRIWIRAMRCFIRNNEEKKNETGLVSADGGLNLRICCHPGPIFIRKRGGMRKKESQER